MIKKVSQNVENKYKAQEDFLTPKVDKKRHKKAEEKTYNYVNFFQNPEVQAIGGFVQNDISQVKQGGLLPIFSRA